MPEEKKDKPILYTYSEAAEILHIHPVSLRRLKMQGKISYLQIGRSIRFKPEYLFVETERIKKAG